MIRHETLRPPQHIYPIDAWKFIERRFYPRFLAQTETIFSVGNGYLGMRGNFEEGAPVFQNGTFINGFHETWPIVYGEEAYGFAKTGQTMLNVTDTKVIRLYVDDEPFYLPTAHLLKFERTLDMQAGVLSREVLWETPAGKQVLIQSHRLVSLQHRHLAAMSYQVTVLNAKAPVVLVSEALGNQPNQAGTDDPRQARGFTGQVLVPQLHEVKDRRLILGHITASSRMTLACGVDHLIETHCPYTTTSQCHEDIGQVVVSVEAEPEVPIRLVKVVAYHTSRRAPVEELCARADRTLDRAVDKTGLEPSEVEAWQKAADAMHLPYDEVVGIIPQDDSFMDKKPWDFDNTPPDKYPLLLFYHPLVIYRHRVIKQADVVLALFLPGDEFSLQTKRRNFEYYEPLTTGDSSLSACVEGIVAFAIGDIEKALAYTRAALLMDLGDVAGNVHDGCHVTATGGSWMLTFYGIAGMRDYDGHLSFNPKMPRQLKRLRFPLTVRSQRLEVDMTHEAATYLLREGSELEITHQSEAVRLTVGNPVSMPLSSYDESSGGKDSTS
jgi:trehalose/maltose hydrolase-like predicted phosphorylase